MPPAFPIARLMTTAAAGPNYGERPTWEVGRPHIHPFRALLAWAVSGIALLVAAGVVPGASVHNFRTALAAAIVPGAVVHDYRSALVAAAAIAVLNAVLPPLVAAIRLPFMALLGFFVVLALDAAILLAADHLTNGDLTVSSFWSALGVALAAAAVGVVLNG